MSIVWRDGTTKHPTHVTNVGGSLVVGKDTDGIATLGRRYDASAYGAAVDGTTDDITALQALVDLIDDTGEGGVLVIPKGSCYITQELELRADNLTVIIEGELLGPTGGTSDGGLLVVVDRTTTTRIIENVAIIGGVVRPRNASDNAVGIVSASNARVIGVNADLTTGQRGFVVENITPAPVSNPLNDVRIIGCGSFGGGSEGIHIGNIDDAAIRNVVVSGHVVDGATTGITVNTGSASKYINRVVLSDILIRGPTTGINFSRVKNGIIQGVTIRDVTTTGLNMAAQAEDCIIDGLIVIGSGTPGSGISLASSSTRNLFGSILIDGSFTYGISANAPNNTFDGVTIRNATTGLNTWSATDYNSYSHFVFASVTTPVNSYRTGDKYFNFVERTGSATDLIRSDKLALFSPSALSSGNNNDYTLPSVLDDITLRLSANASGSTLTGIAGGYDGRIVRVICVANYMTLSHQDTNSSTANRIVTHTGSNITLFTSDSAFLVYDSSSLRWRVINFLTDTIYATHMTWAAGQYINMTNTGADEAIVRCESTSDSVTAAPTTHGVEGFLEFYIDGATRYVPFYTIDGTTST